MDNRAFIAAGEVITSSDLKNQASSEKKSENRSELTVDSALEAENANSKSTRTNGSAFVPRITVTGSDSDSGQCSEESATSGQSDQSNNHLKTFSGISQSSFISVSWAFIRVSSNRSQGTADIPDVICGGVKSTPIKSTRVQNSRDKKHQPWAKPKHLTVVREPMTKEDNLKWNNNTILFDWERDLSDCESAWKELCFVAGWVPC